MLRQASIGAFLVTLVGSTTNGQGGDSLARNAMSAAPHSLAKGAIIMDGSHRIVRGGNNGWLCMPDNPSIANNAPMCLDATWLDFADALMAKRQPDVTRVGIGYMLQGNTPVSNIDPFAKGPTEDNEWLPNAGPHIMIVVPDAKHLEGLPTDPKNGGPWVMWKGTPFAHVMIPTGPRQP